MIFYHQIVLTLNYSTFTAILSLLPLVNFSIISHVKKISLIFMNYLAEMAVFHDMPFLF